MDIVHGSCVSIDGRGLLILGGSGSGKSSLALSLMALGALLVADDRVVLSRSGTQVIASAPDTLKGRIEARGIGILKAGPVVSVAVTQVVDLAHTETARLPEPRTLALLNVRLPLLLRVENPHFPSMLWQLMKAGRDDGAI